MHIRSLSAMAGLVGAVVAGPVVGRGQQEAAGERWPAEKAWAWYRQQPWACGVNFVPSTAANTTELWQAASFDEKTIDRELGWAARIGFNSCRVFVQYLVWKHDP